MDAITLTRVGLKAVVATMGTALTNEHLRLLQSLEARFVFSLMLIKREQRLLIAH